MDVGQLHKLARILREIALDATTETSEGRPNAAELLVATDVFEHSPTSVSEIVRRTGVVQSQVSKIVAMLHDGGVLARESDPKDQRRTLLAVPDDVRRSIGGERGRREIDDVVQAYLSDHQLASGPKEVARLVHLLSELSEDLGIS